MTINPNDIARLIENVCTSVSVPEADYSRSLPDLGVDSLDLSGILLELEEKYSVKIPDKDIGMLQSVNAIAEYLSKDAVR